MVVGVATLAIAASGAVTDTGIRIMLSGAEGLASGSERWVVLTQGGDCLTAVAQARPYARILGWPLATDIRHLVLETSQVSVDSETLFPSVELGRLRTFVVAHSLRVRGWTRTPLLIRTPAHSVGIRVLDLNQIPQRPR